MDLEARNRKFLEDVQNALGYEIKGLNFVVNPQRTQAIKAWQNQFGSIIVEVSDLNPRRLREQFNGQKVDHVSSDNLNWILDKERAEIIFNQYSHQEQPYQARGKKRVYEEGGNPRGERVDIKESFDVPEDVAAMLEQELRALGFGPVLDNLYKHGEPYPHRDFTKPIREIVGSVTGKAVNEINDNHVEIVLGTARAEEKNIYSAADGVRLMSDDMTHQIRVERDDHGLIGVFVENVRVRQEHGVPGQVTSNILATHLTGAWDDAAAEFVQYHIDHPTALEAPVGFELIRP